MSAAWNTGIGDCVYYGAAIVFPQVVNNLYHQTGKISAYDVGTYAGLPNMAFVFAHMCHGLIVWVRRGPKWAMTGSAIIAAPLLSAAAADLDNKALTISLLIPGVYAIGVVESVSITTSKFPLRSQKEIGQSGGLSRSIRNFTLAVTVAVYTATLSNRLFITIPCEVYPIARDLRLPEGSLEALTSALKGVGSYVNVLGLKPQIKDVV